MEYSNKRIKFKIMPLGMREQGDRNQEAEKVRACSDEDRKWQIQAAIVRIMKARKIIRHTPLIDEVPNFIHDIPSFNCKIRNCNAE